MKLTMRLWLWLWLCSCLWLLPEAVLGLGSMSSIAVSYGEKGAAFCALKSHTPTCYGSNTAVTAAAPSRLPFLGLTAGDGFVCGLLRDTRQPYCWGSTAYIQMGVPQPQPLPLPQQYSEISAGDYHLCGLRAPLTGRRRNISVVDCWGYNMTRSFTFDAQVRSISAGSDFTCGLFAQNRSALCWGDGARALIPRGLRFQMLAAGGYHVCGILEGVDSRAVCWGRALDDNNSNAPDSPMLSLAGGKFHSCGIRASDRGVVCWGFLVQPSTSAPQGAQAFQIAAGDYFTCGILAGRSLAPLCWGSGFPTSLPQAVRPLCKSAPPCAPDFYETDSTIANCSRLCMPCTTAGCPPRMQLTAECSAGSDRICGYNCSACISRECLANCSSSDFLSNNNNNQKFWSMQLPVIVAEIAFAVFLVAVVSTTAVLYVRYKLRDCQCADDDANEDGGPISKRSNHHRSNATPFQNDIAKIGPELKIRRAQMFGYEELERATGGFKEESLVGKGSFSYVFRGVLKDSTVVAVKRAIVSHNIHKSWKEFHTELDLLSRLNHAHLLNLLGYCEEGQERLLVYEYMAHGSLHQHLHGRDDALKEQLDWVRRVTIAVQAARGIEYLHGYACPPVIHRDIKSSNILIDQEHNARVADFGLSLLGPADSCSPLPELPAGTLGYLDPEYYRLHYLTTKSDVYSFGVLLLEILSGRKAIHMQHEEGSTVERAVNIVEWAVPLIKAGEVAGILDPVLKVPADVEALKRIANVACKCVRMRGKERPSMDKVTTSLERALALLMGSPCNEQPILPTEVVLGSSRLHKKASQRSSNRSASDVVEMEDQRCEFRAPSWITFPSVTSSQRRKSSVSEADVEGKNSELKSSQTNNDGLRSLEEEICPASPQESLFLHHNF